MLSVQQWASYLTIGLSFGMVLFLLASGFTMTFGLARFVSLAHGAVFLLAGYVAASFAPLSARSLGGYTLAIAAATVTGMTASVAVYAVARLRWRRVSADTLSQVLLTFGFLLVFAEIARSRWEGLPTSMPSPTPLAGVLVVGETSLPAYRLFVMGVSLLIAFGLYLLQDRTTFGALVRAGVDDPEFLQAMGVRTQPLHAAVFAIAGALAGLAAGLAVPVLGVSMGQEFSVLVAALVVVVLGGLGSLRGAFVASIAVGLADALGKGIMPEFADFTMMGLVVIVLAWRPQGLVARSAA
jgi:branched-chain amino acid transport system permease protein